MKHTGLVGVLAVLALATTALAQEPQDKATLTSNLEFVGIAPCRLVDTREAGFPSGYGTPALVASTARTFVIPESRCGVPAAAKAVSMNVTVVSPNAAGFLAIWPGTATNEPSPLVSSLNYVVGSVVPNAVIVPLDASGQVTLVSVAATNVIFDVNGYFAEAAAVTAAGVPSLPAGGIAAATVQGALDELDAEKAAAGHTHTGTGITGMTNSQVLFGAADGGIGSSLGLTFVPNRLTVGTSLMSGYVRVGGSTSFEFMVNPANAVTASGSFALALAPGATTVDVSHTDATETGTGYVYVPVDLPTTLLNQPLYLHGIRLCYDLDEAPAGTTQPYITGVNVYKADEPDPGTQAFPTTTVLSSTEDLLSLTTTCRTITNASPKPLVDGPLSIRVSMAWPGPAPAATAASIRLGRIRVMLSEYE